MELPERVAVVGAGTMGPGIACVFALGGSQVRLASRRRATLDAAERRLPAILGTLGAIDVEASAARVSLTTSTEDALAEAQLVVETIAEEIEPKRDLLALAERLAAPDAILTTNTSALPLDELAAGLSRPDRFAGLHWLNPPELVEVVEVVGTERTDPGVLAALRSLTERLGKAPIVVRRPVSGFVVNRLQYALLREAWALVDRGICSCEDVDRALTHGLGARWAAVGPFETMDLGGVDLFHSISKGLFPELSTAHGPPPFLDDAVAQGRLGLKAGKGLRGCYDGRALESILSRRFRVLFGLPSLRDEGGE